MDVGNLLFYIYKVAGEIIERCKVASKCRREAVRIARRVQGIMATLDQASTTFASDNVDLHTSLLKFQETFIHINSVLKKCAGGFNLLRNASSIAKSLQEAELNLERQCADLQLAMPRAIVTSMKKIVDSGTDEVVESIAEIISAIFEEMAGVGITIQEQIDTLHLRHPRSRMPIICANSATEPTGQDNAERPLQVDGLVPGDVLGEGSFGKVTAATYCGMEVAVKTLKVSTLPESDLANFRKEAERHASLKHPNIVEVFAFSLVNPLCMIMERMHQTLYDLISEGYVLEPAQKREILLGICEGLRFLHGLKLMHLDLKSPNILMKDAVPKLSDFGLSRVASTVKQSTGSTRGSSTAGGSEQWMAPEAFKTDMADLTRKADIFSLHVVFYEVISQVSPTRRMGVGEALAKHHDVKLEVGETSPPGTNIQLLMESCAKVEPKERPDMDTVLRMFEAAWPSSVENLKRYSDGSTYVGDLNDGKRHGQGRLLYLSGDEYKGEFKNDLLDGQGSKTSAGTKHEGAYRDNQANGQGFCTLSDGSTYIGDFRNGEFHGQGTWIGLDGTKYEGGFVNNSYEGQGTWTKNGEWYVGEFKNDKRHGQGMLTKVDGTNYEGQFKNGEFEQQTVAAEVAPMDGMATHRVAMEGASIQTSAIDGSGGVGHTRRQHGSGFTGQGLSKYPDGSTYVGEFKDGKRHGQGKMTYPNGSVYKGMFKKGSFEG